MWRHFGQRQQYVKLREEKDHTATTQYILDNYDILTILEKNQLWKLVLKKVTVYRSQDDKLSIQLYPNLPQ